MKKKYILIAIGVLLIVTAFLINQYIQSAGRNIKAAQQFYNDGEYEKSYKHYLKASKKLPEAHIGAALSVQQLDEKEDSALSHLLKADRDRYHKVSPRAKQHFDQALQEVKEAMMRQLQRHTLGVNQVDDMDEMLENIKRVYEDNGLYDISLGDAQPLPDELTIKFLGEGDNETMNIRITNGGVIFYRLVIPALVVIQQREQGAYQRMLAAETFVIFIKPRAEGEIFIIPMFCLDFSKKPPANGIVYTSVRPHTDVPTHQFYNIRSIIAATSGKKYPHDVIQRAVNVVTGGWNRENLRNELSKSSLQFSSEFLSKAQIRAIISEEIESKVDQIMADVREVLELAKEFDRKNIAEYNGEERRAASQWDRYLTQAR